MHIAVWHDPPRGGGAWRALTELGKRMARRHKVDLILLDRGEGNRVDGLGFNRVELVPFRPRPHRRLAAYWNDWLTYRDIQEIEGLERRVARRIDEGGYDLALVSVLHWGQAPSVLRHLQTPSAYFCHEPPRRFHEAWCRPEAAPLSKYERARQLWRKPTRALLESIIRLRDLSNVQKASRVLTNSHYTRGRIREVYGRDAGVCYLGVDTERFRPAERMASPTAVISVGALEAHKGFDFLIRALGQIPLERRPVLTVVGSGGHSQMPASLCNLAESEGVSLNLRTQVSDDELASLYQSHALFVFGAHYEPFGLVALEAMACGLPVVAVAEGGIVESVQDGSTGYLVPRDEQAFSQAVDKLLSSDDSRESMGRRARDYVMGGWSWEAATQRMERYIEELARPTELWAVRMEAS